jgi:hypothetical protein
MADGAGEELGRRLGFMAFMSSYDGGLFQGAVWKAFKKGLLESGEYERLDSFQIYYGASSAGEFDLSARPVKCDVLYSLEGDPDGEFRRIEMESGEGPEREVWEEENWNVTRAASADPLHLDSEEMEAGLELGSAEPGKPLDLRLRLLAFLCSSEGVRLAADSFRVAKAYLLDDDGETLRNFLADGCSSQPAGLDGLHDIHLRFPLHNDDLLRVGDGSLRYVYYCIAGGYGHWDYFEGDENGHWKWGFLSLNAVKANGKWKFNLIELN